MCAVFTATTYAVFPVKRQQEYVLSFLIACSLLIGQDVALIYPSTGPKPSVYGRYSCADNARVWAASWIACPFLFPIL